MAENLHKLLLHVFNISLQNESFPNEIKIPFIFIYKNPLFKNGRDLGNYRPISVLPCFWKTLEKIMYNRLCKHSSDNEILYRKKTWLSRKTLKQACHNAFSWLN